MKTIALQRGFRDIGRPRGTAFAIEGSPPAPARDASPMSWLTAYCLDFGFCLNYPKAHWSGYFRTLKHYGYNVAWLWVGGILPTPGFEPTLDARCDYVPEIVDELHDLGFRVHLMTGVFGWPGCSPGLLRMRPDIEIDWPEALKKKYPLDSTRRGLCPTRAFDVCLDYVESLYRACPQADGMALEVFCEKPHCRCSACTSRGLWQIELDFLSQAVQRFRAINPNAETIWNTGYERTHGTPPESRLYEELRSFSAPGIVWWHARLENGYTDAEGKRHEWSDPAELAAYGRKALCLPRTPAHFRLARQAGLLGAATVGPNLRNLFLPEIDPKHFGYRVQGPPPEKPLYDHVLFHVWAFRNAAYFQNPELSPDEFRQRVAEQFFSGNPDATARADALLLLEDLIVVKRLCLGRARDRVWGDLDGGDALAQASADRDRWAEVRAIADLPATDRWTADLRTTAEALLACANEAHNHALGKEPNP